MIHSENNSINGNNAFKGIEPEALYKLLAKLIEITLNNYKRKFWPKNSLNGEGLPGRPQILLKKLKKSRI